MLACTLGSCKKWLDLQPETEISRDELFKTEAGFFEALNGAYTKCTEEGLYGLELTMGFPEVLAQNYTVEQGNDPKGYLQTAQYNYKDGNFINRKDNAWRTFYNAIVNSNLIISEIDAKKNVFNPGNYELVKGEAFALRAFLHFDVFRLFGSNLAAKKVGIPYVTAYSNKVTPTASADEVLNNIVKDLEQAKVLLKGVDSILSATYKVGYPVADDSATETSSKSLFLQNRRHRLNYYAVCGELARVYLYKNDKQNALLNAEEVITSKKFPWVKTVDFISVKPEEKDVILYPELIFMWPVQERTSAIFNFFQTGPGGIQLKETTYKSIYESGSVGAEDNRYKHWFSIFDQNFMRIMKYARNPNGDEDDQFANRYPQVVPAIRLSEMYYIAAEASFESNPAKALDYFNTVRMNRGIGTKLNTASYTTFMDELVKEARKEFYAEGQLFYLYKRLNRSIVGQLGNQIAPSPEIFILPLPNDEIEFGGR